MTAEKQHKNPILGTRETLTNLPPPPGNFLLFRFWAYCSTPHRLLSIIYLHFASAHSQNEMSASATKSKKLEPQSKRKVNTAAQHDDGQDAQRQKLLDKHSSRHSAMLSCPRLTCPKRAVPALSNGAETSSAKKKLLEQEAQTSCGRTSCQQRC